MGPDPSLPRWSEDLYVPVVLAARLAHVSDQTIYNRIKDGRLGYLARDDDRNPTGEIQVLSSDVCLMAVNQQASSKAASGTVPDDPTLIEIQMLQSDVRARLEQVIREKDRVIAAKEETLRAKDDQIEALRAELEAALVAQQAATAARLAGLRAR